MPPAGGSSAAEELLLWRAVEAQHVVSTMLLVDTLAEQRLLEDLLEDSKPRVPAAAAGLHFLLSTPFRYPAPLGSRFRGPIDPGVLYGAEELRTALAELGFWRWRFLGDSPDLDRLDAAPQTVFQLLAGGRTVDLRDPPWASRRNDWVDPLSYDACQQLARQVRDDGIQIIRYESVRDPAHGGAAALLHPAAILYPAPLEQETWYLLVTRDRVSWRRWDDELREGWDFEF
jgi:hypothetical protein